MVAPQRYAFDFDHVGLQVGNLDAEIRSAIVSLDRSEDAIAASLDADLLLTHHPLIDRPIESVTTETYEGRAIRNLLRRNVQFIAAHTNWDSARGGVNDALAARLFLTDLQSFGSAAKVRQIKVMFDVDPSDQENFTLRFNEVAQSIPKTEVGEVDGGIRIETTIRRDQLPTLSPLFEFCVRRSVVPLEDEPEQPAGRIGRCTPMSLRAASAYVERHLGTRTETWGDPNRMIERIAVVGGSAGSEWRAAMATGADLFLSGEIRQNVALEAFDAGLAIMSGGHYATEQPGVVALAEKMTELLPQIEWRIFEPAPGLSGRPFYCQIEAQSFGSPDGTRTRDLRRERAAS